MIEITEFQIALFASKFDLSDQDTLIKQIKEKLTFDNPTQNIMPLQPGSLLPSIYISQDDLEVQVGESKINLVYKQINQDILSQDTFLQHIEEFLSIKYFENYSFSRVGFAITEIKHVEKYSDFIKKVFLQSWAEGAETFLSRADYFFKTQKNQAGYLVLLMQSVLNIENKKGTLAQFDISTKETEDINKKPSEIMDVVNDLIDSKFFKDKKTLFEG